MMNSCSVLPFAAVCTKGFNEQIAAEMQAFYQYRAIAYYFSRHDVAFKNVAAKFNAMSLEELEHADTLSRYLQSRGGAVKHAALVAPKIPESLSLVQAFELALSMEKTIHMQLRALHQVIVDAQEVQCASFIEDEFLTGQIADEDELMRTISVLKRMGAGLGEVLFDQELESK